MSDPAADQNDEQEEEEEQQETLTGKEQEASTKGWTTEEQWVADGKDPKEWRTAEHYLQIGENVRLRSENKQYREEVAGFDGRLKKTEELIKAGYEVQISELEAKRDEATGDGSVEKSVAIQKEIDDLKDKNKTTELAAAAADPLLDQWNKDNPWIDNPGAKSTFAGNLYQRGLKDGMGIEDILTMVEQEVEKEYPGTISGQPKTKVINARRQEASTTTSGKTKTGKTAGLTLSDITPEENQMRRNLSMYAGKENDEKFLKAVARTRAQEAEENE